MEDASPPNFVRLAGGTLLQRETDGSYKPTRSLTDHVGLAALTDEEIERMAANDPDHPALDDAFWAGTERQNAPDGANTVKLDADILAYFRDQGEGYETRINAVLRRYLDAQQKEHL